MRPLTKIIVWGLAVVIIGAGVYFYLMSLGRHSEIAMPGLPDRLPPAAVNHRPRTVPGYQPVVVPHDLEKSRGFKASSAAPPKKPLNLNTRTETYAPPTPPPTKPLSTQQKIVVPHISEHREKLKDIQSRLLQMIRKNPAKIDVQQLDTILTELDQLKDNNGLVGGVNISALRQNLAVTGKVLKLSSQIQQEARKPPGQIDMTKLKAETEQLQELQKKLVPANLYTAPAPGK